MAKFGKMTTKETTKATQRDPSNANDPEVAAEVDENPGEKILAADDGYREDLALGLTLAEEDIVLGEKDRILVAGRRV